ncbi:hypothetical protein E1B28_000071 [Marasmius oreades]|uniref:Uncharacterized protein n=1 Tax=Marasmius oreades TaxID=181124 RepID=A0A9P8ADY8_9AGAR|nr:uncharacterized protein E1B28_000071 [Marasmius oreades]KAG7098097.1 hypothetical protein E1B28_000071 [Marasmius oreades]
MGFSHLFFALLYLSADAQALSINSHAPYSSGPIPNRYVVEFNQDASGFKRDSTPHQEFRQALESQDVRHVVRKEYNHPVFKGVSLQVEDYTDVFELKNLPGVKAVHQARRFPPPRVPARVVSSAKDPNFPTDSQSSHTLTGVNKLHAQGITGKGIKIGMIDTGVDYKHPALGGGIGPNFKVVGGFDFVGDDYTGANEPVPDSDPMDQCNGHGTHVAGIIGADPGGPENPFNVTGVAYSASLSAYRVLGCEGGVEDEVVIEALLRAAEDGNNVITLSLGGPSGWSQSPSALVASNIADSGVAVTAAAGNEGKTGAWFAEFPAGGKSVISVASVDNSVFPVVTARVHGVDHAPIPYDAVFPLTSVPTPFPIFALSNDTTVADDACDPLPDSIPDLSQYVVVARRGSCTFEQKLRNIGAKRGNLTLFYNNEPGLLGIEVGEFQAALIRAEDGEFLVKQFVDGVPIMLSFDEDLEQFRDPAGGLVSLFSNYGPTNEMDFKPSVAAPGGNILSTLPTALGSYGIRSGTSMSTPYVAGVVALLLEVNGQSDEVSRNMRTLLQTTAASVPSNYTEGAPLQTLAQQGAGLVNAFNAAYATTLVSPGELLLNDTENFQPVHNFTVLNSAPSSKTYKLSHEPAGTVATVTEGTNFTAVGPLPLSNDYADLTLSETTFTLQPGERKTITATFAPLKEDSNTLPVYSGFIRIESGDDGEPPLHVSYLGAGGSLKDRQVIDNTDVVFGVTLPVILNATGDPQEVPTNYTFQDGDFPSLLARLNFGTPLLIIDLVQSNTEINITLNKRGSFGPAFTNPNKREPGGIFTDVPISGRLFEFPYLPRNTLEEGGLNPFNQFNITEPIFANGTTVPNGAYKILLSALKVTGDPSNELDYETWLSPVVVGVSVPS